MKTRIGVSMTDSSEEMKEMDGLRLVGGASSRIELRVGAYPHPTSLSKLISTPGSILKPYHIPVRVLATLMGVGGLYFQPVNGDDLSATAGSLWTLYCP